MSVRVLVADDHPVFLDGLRLLLDSAPDVEVVGSAPDGATLLALASEVDHDVVVVDLDMPGVGGVDVTRALVADDPTAAVLVLTMHDDESSVHRALEAGARGYVLKGAAHGTIVRAIHALAEGDTVLNGPVGRTVLRAATAVGPRAAFPFLTAREVEVLDLLGRGLTNRAIAEQLFLSVKTIQNRVSDVMGKLGASTRAELVARARDAGLGDP